MTACAGSLEQHDDPNMYILVSLTPFTVSTTVMKQLL